MNKTIVNKIKHLELMGYTTCVVESSKSVFIELKCKSGNKVKYWASFDELYKDGCIEKIVKTINSRIKSIL